MVKECAGLRLDSRGTVSGSRKFENKPEDQCVIYLPGSPLGSVQRQVRNSVIFCELDDMT